MNTHGNAPLGVWNASSDPNGYNEIFSLQLQGLLYNSSPTLFYDTFYSGGAHAPAVANPLTTKVEHEAQAALLLKSGIVSAIITYRSYAVVNDLTYVSFNPIVGLEANNSSALADYSETNTTIYTSTGGPRRSAPRRSCSRSRCRRTRPMLLSARRLSTFSFPRRGAPSYRPAARSRRSLLAGWTSLARFHPCSRRT